jgi:hypothetical protein
MQLLRGFGPLAVFAAAACTAPAEGPPASSEDRLVSSAPPPFSVDALKGKAKATFVTPSGLTELCIVPGHFIGDGFTDEDQATESQLCQVDWNASPRQGVVAAGLQPTASDATVTTDVEQVTADLVRDIVESVEQANAQPRKATIIGRLRSSLDAARFGGVTAYAPSTIAYYGTSRMLGGIGGVTPAVWRTLDVSRHLKVAGNGEKLTVQAAQTVRPLWTSFAQTDAAAAGKNLLTYSTDGSELYAAFVAATPGDVLDTSIDTADKLTGSARFQALIDPDPLDRTVGHDTEVALKAMIPMQGVVEMLVLDAIMLEDDRFRGGRIRSAPYVSSGVRVDKLVLSDVDGGLLARTPQAVQDGFGFGLLRRIAHIGPDLYARVRKLGTMVENPELATFTQSEWRFTPRDWLRYREMAIALSTLLHDRCTAGALHLDLDVAAHLESRPAPGCDL